MSGYERTDYSQQGPGYGRDRRYSGGRNDAGYGSGIRREETYRSENHLNQKQKQEQEQGLGESNSYYNSNDDFQSSGQNEGRNEGRNDNERHDIYNQGGQDSNYEGGGRQDQYENNHNGEGDDFSSAAKHATQHAGSSADSNIFSSVLSALGQNRQSIATQNVNEQGSFLHS